MEKTAAMTDNNRFIVSTRKEYLAKLGLSDTIDVLFFSVHKARYGRWPGEVFKEGSQTMLYLGKRSRRFRKDEGYAIKMGSNGHIQRGEFAYSVPDEQVDIAGYMLPSRLREIRRRLRR